MQPSKISHGLKRFMKKWRQQSGHDPEIFQHEQHQIASHRISQNALQVMQQLHKAGYKAYLVGGSVRDLLVNCEPKDFDVVTNANPEKIRKLFMRSRIIGKRFRLVHVYFRGEIIEVSTFRANNNASSKPSSLAASLDHHPSMLAADNTYGTIEEDAWRRDFTINALYYNSKDNTVIDYTGGMHDLNAKIIRMIGEPAQRFHEDPVRLLRAIRLAAKLNFTIDAPIERSLVALANLLYHVPAARILDEVMKLFSKGHALATFRKLSEYGCFTILFPRTATALEILPLSTTYQTLFELALKTTDDRFNHNMSINPAFLFSIFLWPAVQLQLQELETEHKLFATRLRVAIRMVLAEQQDICVLSKRLSLMIRSVWLLQSYLTKPTLRQMDKIIQHRYFRAAIDFLQLRVESGEPYFELAQWWNQIRNASHEQQVEMIAEFFHPDKVK